MRCCAWDVLEEIVRILQEVEDEMVDILALRSTARFGALFSPGLPISAHSLRNYWLPAE